MPNKSKPSWTEEADDLTSFLKRHQIRDWDILLFGDGSGSGWQQPIGWGCFSIERSPPPNEPHWRPWCGSMNKGTVNVAETMAYVQALLFFISQDEERRKKHGTRRMVQHVHIFTDSQYVQKTGGGNDREIRKNSLLWSLLDGIRRQGFLTNWHWFRRDTDPFNVYADRLSKLASGLYKKHDLVSRVNAELLHTIESFLGS